jgi:hypothetical protein
MYISRFRKTIHVEGTPQEEKEARQRARRAMYAAAKKEQERQRDLDRRGFCPDCYYLLSLTGKCPKCGLTYKFHKGGNMHV